MREYNVSTAEPCSANLGQDNEEFRIGIQVKLKELDLWRIGKTCFIDEPGKWVTPKWSLRINLGLMDRADSGELDCLS
jgi:hypothetical protein